MPSSPTLVSYSVPGRRCRDLLVQLYLQWPELRVPAPEALLHGGGAAGGSTCKVSDGGARRWGSHFRLMKKCGCSDLQLKWERGWHRCVRVAGEVEGPCPHTPGFPP